MSQLFLIGRIAGQRVAMPSAAIDSVVEIETVTPVPRGPAHVAGLAALRSRVLTVIDSEAALGLPASRHAEAGPRDAVVVTCDGHLYGLLVDAIDDIESIEGAAAPLRSGLGSGWVRIASGMIERDGEALLVIDPAALVAGAGPVNAMVTTAG